MIYPAVPFPDDMPCPGASKQVVAILDTMWGDPRALLTGQQYPKDAPPWFRINPANHSGRRLYSLIGDAHLRVTNSCRELVYSAKQHGKPDPAWLADNLTAMYETQLFDVLLVCGTVARKTFDASGYHATAEVIYLPHPAARFVWSADKVAEIRARIAQCGPTA